MNETALPPARDLLGQGDYVRFWISRCLGSLGSNIQGVAMGWQVYALSRRTLDVAHSAFNVSLIGLVSFLPMFLLALPAGEAADRHDRRGVMLVCYAGEVVVVGLMAAASLMDFATIPLLLGLCLWFGTSSAFYSPAVTALGPMLVPRELLPRAIAWNSLAGLFARIIGPMIAGIIVAAASPGWAYCLTLALYVPAVLILITIRGNTRPVAQSGSRLSLVREGLVYVRENKVVLGAISLDLAAVLLGGATALLPAFARDVLHVGARGFGLLRAAPSAGAALVGLFLAAHPIRRRAGTIMFGGVAVFGAATILFGLSRLMWLSVVALAVLGAADMISVFVRQTLVQLVTPDPMRGRVAAVSTLSVGASNELGEFESGLVARFLGPVGAAVFGGVGALIATGAWAKLFPALRRADRLE
ncbi:MAG: MFS transporter [Caulobacteraceae bacterium]